MTTVEFLSRLRAADIALSVSGGQLRINAPRGALTAALREELATRKPEILDLLRERPGSGSSVVDAIPRVDRTGRLPLSFTQRGIWFVDRLHPGAPVFNVPTTLHLQGDLDRAALSSSVRQLVQRHEALRTTIGDHAGEPMLVVHPQVAVDVPAVDLSDLPHRERELTLQAAITEEATRPFDLGAGPLFRCRLWLLGDQEHVLQVNLHHIVSDGWSVRVLASELEALYATHLGETRRPLPELFVQYADVAAWEHSWLQGEHAARDLAFWKEHLRGSPTLLQLPTDRLRPAEGSVDGAVRSRMLPKELQDNLQVLSAREKTTLFTTLFAAFNVLVYRYTGEPDLVIGTAAANRDRLDTESVLGCFVNMLAIRSDLNGRPTFRDLLRRIHDAMLEAIGHQHMPLDKLIEELRPERSKSANPLIQVTFGHQGDSDSAFRFPGLVVRQMQAWTSTAKYDLTLSADSTAEGLQVSVEYRTDLFDAATIDRLLGHYATLLAGIDASPASVIDDLPLLTEPERRQLLDDFGQPAVVLPAPAPLVDEGSTLTASVRHHAARTPDAIAVTCGHDSLSYRELQVRVDRLARRLRALGVGPDVLVGLLVERSLDMVVGVLGILEAGGAYVPLDPEFPRSRLDYIRRDSGLGVLVTHRGLEARLETVASTVRLDTDLNGDGGASGQPADVTLASAEHLANVLYTSGSTGRPKGVEILRGALLNLLRSMQREPGFEATDTLLAVSTLTFDIASLEVLLPLLCGGCVVVATREEVLDPKRLIEVIDQTGCSVMQATPTLWRALVDANWAGSPNLRILCGGEPLRPDLASGLLERCAEVWNLYGPTEATIYATGGRVTGGEQIDIGRPIANVTTRILDARRQLVPIGVPGGLFVGGAGLARGYVNQPELTAAKFTVDPFGADSSSRLYETGDRCRYLPNGRIEHLGRGDDQVKIRGFRIELGEVEAVLGQDSDIHSCVVVAREAESGEHELVAYFEAKPESAITISDLRRHLKGELPDYMVPSVFVRVDEWPLTSSGKVDRQALPAPVAARDAEVATVVAPRSPTEVRLATIWRTVLGVADVGVHDDFFLLGGHSLLAMRVAYAVDEEFGVHLAPSVLFEHSVLADLARHLDGIAREAVPADPPIPQAGRTGRLPLSFAQRGIWFVDQLKPGTAVFNVPTTLRLCGPLDQAALTWSLAAIVERHEALRTTFEDRDGAPVQIVHPTLPPAVTTVDRRERPAATREAVVQDEITAEAQRSFDLTTGPLFRCRVWVLGAEEHVVQLTLHHIVADGWSLGVIARELEAFYASRVTGTPASLPELAVQYPDVAVWEAEWFTSPAYARHLAYWTTHLADAPTLLPLAADRPRPALMTVRGAVRTRLLPTTLLEQVRALGAKEQATVFATLLTAFTVLLHRHTGMPDFVVGVPAANRSRAETESLVGCFMNLLALRADLGGNPTVQELLRRTRRVVADGLTHDAMPFDKLVEELRPARSGSASPLVQVVFSHQDGSESDVRLSGLAVEPLQADTATAKYDLTLFTRATAAGLHLTAEYSADLFDTETIDRLLDHYAVLLAGIVANPACPIDELPLLAEPERRRLLGDFGQSSVVLPALDPTADKGSTLTARIERHAAQRPDAIAVACLGKTLSYRELNARADRLAHRLRQLGVGPDVLVGVLTARSLDMVVALLGVLKAGGAYVPLDPEFPRSRLDYVVQDSGLRVLVTHRGFEANLSAVPSTVRLDADLDRVDRAERLPAESVPAGAEHLANVLYTSGSTGKPKGVEISRGALFNLLRSMQHEPGFEATDVLLAVTTLTFDIAGLEVLLPLISGGCVVVAAREEVVDPKRLIELIDRTGCTVMQATPALWRALIDAGWTGSSTLRILCGGEALRPDLAGELLGRGAAVWNLYGPTEATIWATAGRVRNSVQVDIGRPLANVTTRILDSHRQPVPIGVTGELFVGGAGLARGYVNQAELTAAKFTHDPFAPDAGARLYATGDRCRFLSNGSIVHLGRGDDQVKVRGFRIELGEVEAVLGQSSEINSCVVVARVSPSGDNDLIAYVEATPDSTIAVGDLRAYLKHELPDYMVPSVFVRVDEWPLTASGKIDRQALPAPVAARDAEVATAVAPRSPTEVRLAAIWRTVLGIADVGVHDDFFLLGGHSLLAMRVAYGVDQEFGIRLSPSALFEFPVFGDLAGHVETVVQQDVPEDPPIRRAVRTGRLPLSFAQRGIWFVDQLKPGTAVFNVPTTLRLRGPLDEAALAWSLAAIVERHEALRTTFEDRDGAPVQVVHPTMPPAVSTVDRRGLPAATREAVVQDEISAEAQRSFDLTTGPLFRCRVWMLGEEEHVVQLTLHHIVADGWSLGVIARELEVLYASRVTGTPASLPELAVQYPDVAVWEAAWFTSPAYARDLAYWTTHLAGVPPFLALATDGTRPTGLSVHGAVRTLKLPTTLLQRARDLAAGEQTTLFTTLLTAFTVLLHRHTGMPDFVVGVPAANRSRAETESLVGCFVNLLALHGDLSGDPTVRELLRRTRQVVTEALTHDAMPFDKLVEELRPGRSGSASPLVQVVFSHQDGSESAFRLAGLAVEPMWADTATTKYDLTLFTSETAAGLHLTAEYSTDLFDAAAVDRLLGHFGRLLEEIVSHPTARISTLEMLDKGEEARLLELSDPKRDAAARQPLESCVHELFEAQAARSPDSVAVASEDERLTYEDLNARANQLAHYLRGIGVGRDTLVGVCLERSPSLLVALLGILKAGGAYLPLDAGYPPSRLDVLVRDAGLQLVLTQPELAKQFAGTDVQVCRLDAEQARLAAQPMTNPPRHGEANSLAYVIYTSGSTGEPKGVAVEHRGIVRLVCGNTYATFGPDRVFLQLAPVSFDASTFEIWGALLHGSTLVLAPSGPLDFATMEAVLREHRVTTLWLTASLFNQIVEGRPALLGTVEEVLTGGEALSVRHIRLARERLPSRVRLVNGYGPTESTTFACCYQIPAELPAGSSIPIGRPITGTQAYVLDAARQLAPVGVEGELYLGGWGLARGYLNSPELTAQRFVASPFEAGARLYRTGDRARWRQDGTLEFLGRLDRQVKLLGFRIEPGEVESVLVAHPAVSQAAVVLREDRPGDPRLVGYYTVEGETASEELHAHLRERLPGFMVPSALVGLDRLPLTVNGKLDRNALPAPTYRRAVSSSRDSSTPTEARLMKIWRDVLGVADVGVHDDFFLLGGHSLMAMRLLHEAHLEFGVQLPPGTLFEHTTLTGLAGYIDASLATPPGARSLQNPLVRMEAGGPGRPLFWVHGIFGEVHSYSQLSKHLAVDRPVYGFTADWMQEDGHEELRIESIAERYVGELRKVQPEGPYYLGGFCQAAKLALEMIRQLEADGQQIGILTAIDGNVLVEGAAPLSGLNAARAFARNLPRWIRQDAIVSGGRDLSGRVRTGVRRARSRLRRSSDNGVARAGDVRDQHGMWRAPDYLVPLLEAHLQAFTSYQPEPYNGSVALFLPRVAPLLGPWWPAKGFGWDRIATAGVEIHEVPGSHSTMMRGPFASGLAARIRQSLQQDERRLSQSTGPT